MTIRELLHEIVDKLPESELPAAARMLTSLERPFDPVQVALANAPLDDESDDDDLDGGLTAARNESRSGQTISHEELLRRLGIDE